MSVVPLWFPHVADAGITVRSIVLRSSILIWAGEPLEVIFPAVHPPFSMGECVSNIPMPPYRLGAWRPYPPLPRLPSEDGRSCATKIAFSILASSPRVQVTVWTRGLSKDRVAALDHAGRNTMAEHENTMRLTWGLLFKASRMRLRLRAWKLPARCIRSAFAGCGWRCTLLHSKNVGVISNLQSFPRNPILVGFPETGWLNHGSLLRKLVVERP